MARRASGPEVVTIFWRDIPAQVNGQSGRDRHQVLLSAKFQRAVDRAKRKAGIHTADDDIAQWRRVSQPCADFVADADRIAGELEAAYSREYLGKLAYAGGFAAGVTDDPVDRGELAALEELDEPADPSPADPAPDDPAPADPAPADPAPADPAPDDPAPDDPAPDDPSPADRSSADEPTGDRP